jgi:hypothetical protein
MEIGVRQSPYYDIRTNGTVPPNEYSTQVVMSTLREIPTFGNALRLRALRTGCLVSSEQIALSIEGFLDHNRPPT